MYMETITATRELTPELAQRLADTAVGSTSRVTISCHDRSVNLPVLPWAWAELRVRPGDTVTVTADSGHRPPDLEDRRVLSAVVAALTAAG
ncbi:HPr family phosphocarrier protein [Nocardia otitidiscaviarum]|uniref:HPr family phosphocarrier protein n=1 Tax=Nocardia otitidiscaviarum TaxID=1823 RepID=UPI0011DCB516|nr:HPr family phosphocarrier protein [Nocardia otitidiscaviarum]MBF6138031.1 HPr family phosphocarrier protein [Nocardia otitidiscaviarum]MBF6489095.1 HPr family phosphocarrier protein [Nocardia otitidiscaviarum]